MFQMIVMIDTVVRLFSQCWIPGFCFPIRSYIGLEFNYHFTPYNLFGDRFVGNIGNWLLVLDCPMDHEVLYLNIKIIHKKSANEQFALSSLRIPVAYSFYAHPPNKGFCN
jgi:hypothetical protein